jgi:hypothetical protein
MSNHIHLVADTPAPAWLALDRVRPLFVDVPDWQSNYASYVAEKIGSTEKLWDKVRHGIFLGTDLWLQKMRRTSIRSRGRQTIRGSSGSWGVRTCRE